MNPSFFTRASLLVSTHELPEHLALVCAALERQSAKDFEVLICDDGSGPATRAVVEEFKKRVSFRVEHVWQEHQGFRKCRILNAALRQARGNVFIFLDGDCVPHRHYISDHLREQQEGYYLAGRRMEIGQKLSAWLTPDRVRAGYFDFPRPSLVASVLRSDSEHLQRSLRIPLNPLRRLLKMGRVADLKGCNYSVPRRVLEKLNGFDEEYEGYGREDTDVEIRMQHLGFKIKSLKGLALQFHIWHPRREFTPSNDNRLEELKNSDRVRCERGWLSAP